MPENTDHTPDAVEDDKPDQSAALVAEEVHEPAEKPEGAPGFVPLSGLPRRRRADFFQAIRSIDMEAVTSGEETLATAADAYEMLACIEEAMAIVVLPLPGSKGAYEKWVNDAADEQLSQLFGWYMQEMSPGEAQPSPTS